MDNKSEKILLDRREWLKSHGFVDDPFPYKAIRAETDPMFVKGDLTAFVDLPGYHQFRGSLEDPRSPYILGIPGSGKSSLRWRIKRECDESLLGPPSGTEILAVEYVNHEYDLDEADIYSHIVRITSLIRTEADKLSLNMEFDIPSKPNPVAFFKEILTACTTVGVDGICVLVDKIDAQANIGLVESIRKIESLATFTNLFDVNGLVFKFMLPARSREVRNNLPFSKYIPREIKWSEANLREVLEQRLIACLDAEFLDADISPLGELCDGSLSDTIEDELVQFGLWAKQPRAMWQLGDALLYEHFASSSDGNHRYADELIKPEILVRVKKSITPLLSKQMRQVGQGISPNLCRRLRDSLLACGSFNSNRDVRSVFLDSRIYAWRNNLPEGDNRGERVGLIIDFLYDKYCDDGENALIVFLYVLSDQVGLDSNCQQSLRNLARDLKAELS